MVKKNTNQKTIGMEKAWDVGELGLVNVGTQLWRGKIPEQGGPPSNYRWGEITPIEYRQPLVQPQA